MKDRKFKIFLSHIDEEKEIAVRLKQTLEELYLGAVEIFVSAADDGISGGDRWLSTIEQRIKDCDLALILASPQSICRPWINFEAGGAWFLRKRVIPLCTLGMAADSLPEPLHSLQARNLLNGEDLRMLLNDISKGSGLRVPSGDLESRYNAIFASAPDSPRSESCQDPEKTVVEQGEAELPALTENSTVFFAGRMADAFPGVRGLQWFSDPNVAVERLLILLRQPLRFRIRGGGYTLPIWWWRGTTNGQIETFRALSETKCLMNNHELELQTVAAYRDVSYYRDFVYVQAKPETPVGLYDYPEGHIDDWTKRWGYYSEEYAVHSGRAISRAEYDDGAAVIDGKVIETFGAELRVRHLAEYNFIVAAHQSPINCHDFDDLCTALLNGLLTKEQSFDAFVEAIRKLPKKSQG